MRSTHLFHVWINSRKDDWKARRKDEKNKLANTYGSVSLSFLGCTFHFLRMTQTIILFLTFQSSSHFQKIAQFSGPHSTFFSFLPGWCLLANKKIFETKITAERTGCNKLTQTSSSVTLTRNYLSDVSRVLILTFVLSLERSTITNSQCQDNLSSGKNFPFLRRKKVHGTKKVLMQFDASIFLRHYFTLKSFDSLNLQSIDFWCVFLSCSNYLFWCMQDFQWFRIIEYQTFEILTLYFI